MSKEVANAEKVEFLKTTKNDIPKIDVRRIITEEGFNWREVDNFGDIPALALSILTVGLLEPLIGHKVRKSENHLLTDGHRRFAAIMYAFEAHEKKVPGFENIDSIRMVEFKPAPANLKDRLYIMAITGTTKRLLSDVERAKMFEQLIAIGKEEGKNEKEVVKEIISKLGVSKATIYNTLTITKLPDVIKQRIIANEIGSSVVLGITRELKNPEEQIKAVEAAIANANQAYAVTGKKVKATAKNVKGSANKSPMARIEELIEKLDKNEVKNTRVVALKALFAGLQEKKKVNQLYELFR